MIALERDVLSWKRIARQTLKNTAAVRSAIKIITQRNSQAVFCRLTRSVEISTNLLRNLIEQIGPAMDVPDDIHSSIDN